MPRSKIFGSFAEAVADIPDGSVVGFGGFAVVGMPINLYEAVAKQGLWTIYRRSHPSPAGTELAAHRIAEEVQRLHMPGR